MAKSLKEDIRSLITNGPPHRDTIAEIAERGYHVIASLPLHNIQPNYGLEGDYITYYVKAEVVNLPDGSAEEGSF